VGKRLKKLEPAASLISVHH